MMETRWGPCCRRNGRRCQSSRAQALTQNSCDSILATSQECGNCGMGDMRYNMLQPLRTMVAESLAKVLEPMGFAPGRTSQSISQKHFRMMKDDVFLELFWQSLWNPCQPMNGFQAWPGAMRQADAGRARPTPLRIQFLTLLWLCLAVCSNPMVEILHR